MAPCCAPDGSSSMAVSPMYKGHLVTKTRLSNPDLTAIFYERIRESPGCPEGISVAIIPAGRWGWTALMNAGQRRRHPLCAKRFDAVLNELRANYDLARDGAKVWAG